MFELGKVFQDLEILAIPTRTSFRGITSREVAIFRGSSGWSEFAPFIEYEAPEAKSWMQAALEAAYKPWPELRRDEIEINATLPRVTADRVPEILKRFPGVKTIKNITIPTCGVMLMSRAGNTVFTNKSPPALT